MLGSRRLAGVGVCCILVAATAGASVFGVLAWRDRANQRAAEVQRRLMDEKVSEMAARKARREAAASGLPQFVNVTRQAGIDFVHATLPLRSDVYRMTGGAAAGDYDGDGWIDLFLGQTDGPPVLYRNLGPDPETGEVRFENAASAAGILEPERGANCGLWVDVDNDGDLDLYITATNLPRYFLYINRGDGTFSECALERGADLTSSVPHFGVSAAAGDYDNDGYPDIVVTEWLFRQLVDDESSGLRLLRNLGKDKPGYFVDVTESAGVIMPRGAPQGENVPIPDRSPVSFAPRFTDLDGDGLVDLAVTSDYGTSRLFWGNGDGTFTDGTVSAGIGTGTNEMGSAIADYDGDGRLEWFVTSIHHGARIESEGNRLYRNEGGRIFSDRTREAGVDDTGWGWGAAFFDYDNDAFIDLIATNGLPQLNGEFFARYTAWPTTLWRNNGEGGIATTFSDVGKQCGITDDLSGKGLLTFDYDNDGDLDVFIVNNGSKLHFEHGTAPTGPMATPPEDIGRPILYRNEGGNRNAWLRVRAVGTVSNRHGLGSLVTVRDSRLPRLLVWEINAGSHFLGQSPAEAHFGLGQFVTDAVEEVTIRWPSGLTQKFSSVPVNRTLVAEEWFESPPQTREKAPELADAGAADRPFQSPRDARRRGIPTVFIAAADDDNELAQPDAVLEWNRTLRRLVRETNKFDPATRIGGDRPPEVAREMAMVHLAIFDAVNSFDRKWKPYVAYVDVPPNASREAAVTGAAEDVLSSLYGRRGIIVSRRNTQLANLRAAGVSEKSIADGLAVGRAAAKQIIEARENDGADAVVSWPDSDEPGKYRTDVWTPWAESPPSAPQWPKVNPFVMKTQSQFRKPGPPPLGSEAYRQAIDDVEKYGDRRRYDPTRYPGGKLPKDIQWERNTAFYWAAKGLSPDSAKNNLGTTTPVGHWNVIAECVSQERKLSLEENARLFALLNVAMADAGIACWEMKYHYNLWRPIHAILVPAGKSGADDWLPLIPTSMHPEYPSGHSTFSGAAAEVLARYFGTDAVTFRCGGDDALIDLTTGEREVRTYHSFRQAAEEAGRSRIFGGIHYQFSNVDGLQTGKEIGAYVVENALTPAE